MAKTGPKTKAGKAVVALNAVRHGIRSNAAVVPGIENADEWDAHLAGILESLSPVGRLEQELAERVAQLTWRLRRVVRFESESIALLQEKAAEDLADARAPLFSLYPDPTPDDQAARLAESERVLTLLQVVTSMPEAEPVPARDAVTILLAATSLVNRDVDDFHLPGIPAGDDPAEYPSWTAELLRACLSAIATQSARSLDSLLADTARALGYRVAGARAAIEKNNRDLDRMRRERLIPDDFCLQRVTRYEAHLHRLLITTLRELEALQNRRRGEPAPLARLDVSALTDN